MSAFTCPKELFLNTDSDFDGEERPIRKRKRISHSDAAASAAAVDNSKDVDFTMLFLLFSW